MDSSVGLVCPRLGKRPLGGIVNPVDVPKPFNSRDTALWETTPVKSPANHFCGTAAHRTGLRRNRRLPGVSVRSENAPLRNQSYLRVACDPLGTSHEFLAGGEKRACIYVRTAERHSVQHRSSNRVANLCRRAAFQECSEPLTKAGLHVGGGVPWFEARVNFISPPPAWQVASK
jgi:hypothetical protein